MLPIYGEAFGFTQHTDTSRCDSSRDALFVGRSLTLQAGRWAVSVSC